MKDERKRRVKCNYSLTIHVERINIKEKEKIVKQQGQTNNINATHIRGFISIYNSRSSEGNI